VAEVARDERTKYHRCRSYSPLDDLLISAVPRSRQPWAQLSRWTTCTERSHGGRIGVIHLAFRI